MSTAVHMTRTFVKARTVTMPFAVYSTSLTSVAQLAENSILLYSMTVYCHNS